MINLGMNELKQLFRQEFNLLARRGGTGVKEWVLQTEKGNEGPPNQNEHFVHRKCLRTLLAKVVFPDCLRPVIDTMDARLECNRKN